MDFVTREYLLDTYQAALDEGIAALFVGAGMSRPGHLDWRGLMRGIAKDLKLDVDKETDLIAVAQYHVNQKKGRAAINRTLIEEFTKGVEPTENHRLIASLPIRTIWTTNYDRLLEQAFERAHKRVDAKFTTDQLTTTRPKRDVTVYKMHGDIEHPNDAVLTKSDFETFEEKRRFFSMQLQGDLLSKTFLFLGYSFSDPNIDYILGRIRALVGESKREHFCVMRRVVPPRVRAGKKLADYEYEQRKLELRVDDLQHYGVHTHLINEFDEVTDIFRELKRRVNRKNIFISGSAADFAPLEQTRVEGLSRSLGARIIDAGYNLVSGLGLGIGGAVTIGAMESLYRSPGSHLDERAILRPFPQVAPSKGSLADMWSRYRREMIGRAGFAVFLCGNKLGPDGSIVDANGVREEFTIAVDHGVYPIPIGMTGSASRQLWEAVMADRKKYFGPHAAQVKAPLAELNRADASDEAILNAVFDIVKTISPK